MLVRRIAALSLTVAAIGTTAAPAMAASTPHWASSKCSSYAKKYTHSKKSLKNGANKTLKSHGCKVKVK